MCALVLLVAGAATVVAVASVVGFAALDADFGARTFTTESFLTLLLLREKALCVAADDCCGQEQQDGK